MAAGFYLLLYSFPLIWVAKERWLPSTKHFSVESKLKMCYFLVFAVASAQGRFLSLYLKEQLELSDSQIGQILSVSQVMKIFGPPFGAYLADNYVGRKVVVINAVAVQTLFFALYGLVQFHFPALSHAIKLTLFFAIRLCTATVRSMNYPMIDAESLDYFSNLPPDKLQHLETQGKDNATAEGVEGAAEGEDEQDATVKNKELDAEAKKKLAKNKWGEIRVYGAIGWGMCSLAIGIVMDLVGTTAVMVDIAFVVTFYAIIAVHMTFAPFVPPSSTKASPTAAASEEAIKLAPVEVTQGPDSAQPSTTADAPARGAFRHFFYVFCGNFQGIVFLLMLFFSSSGMVLVEGLVFLYFVEELQLSYFVCGISVLITVLFELPIFHYSEKLVQKLGHDVMIIIGLLSYSLRVFVYTAIPEDNKLLVLSVEWMHGITIGTITIARTLKVSEFAPRGFETTFQGITAGIVGAGAFLGEVLGSYGFELIGKRWTYRTASLVVSSTALMYFLSSDLNCFWRKPIFSKKYKRVKSFEQESNPDGVNIEIEMKRMNVKANELA